jgi:hypothetical protein
MEAVIVLELSFRSSVQDSISSLQKISCATVANAFVSSTPSTKVASASRNGPRQALYRKQFSFDAVRPTLSVTPDGSVARSPSWPRRRGSKIHDATVLTCRLGIRFPVSHCSTRSQKTSVIAGIISSSRRRKIEPVDVQQSRPANFLPIVDGQVRLS